MRKLPLVVRVFVGETFLDLIWFEKACFSPIVELTLFEVVLVKAAEERIGVVEQGNLLHNWLIILLELFLFQIRN